MESRRSGRAAGRALLVSFVLGSVLAASTAAGVADTAGAEVTTGDITRAEERLAEARGALAGAESELDAALRRLETIDGTLDRLAQRIEDADRRIAERRDETRRRIARMYIVAGSGGTTLLSYDDPARASTQNAYLGAVTDRDLAAVTSLAAGRGELRRLRADAETLREEQVVLVDGLRSEVDRRRTAEENAAAEVEGVRAEWQRQEEERLRREEEQRRREEEERLRREEEERLRREEEERRREAAQAAIDDAQHAAAELGYVPGAGAEQWRWLVAQYFPERLVDEAISVMACESNGDPLIVNPFSGAAGLFQQMPAYWPSRSANAGFAGASIFHAEANIAVSAWLVAASERVGHSPWKHWSCKP
jgi:septal ring factor EnvC (AmiA/AmiB activator)